jgi:hypothetical protein
MIMIAVIAIAIMVNNNAKITRFSRMVENGN